MKSPLTFIHKFSLLGFLVSVFVCFPLWHGFREFPSIPVLGVFENVGPFVNCVFLGILICSILVSLFTNKQKIFTPIILLSYFILILFDVNRFRPEFYFFAMTLLIVYLADTKKTSESDTFLILRILVSAVYIFAGLNKLSDSFLPNLFEPMMKPLQYLFSKSLFKLFTSLSIMTPLVEIFLGVALWIPKLRNITWKISVLVHVFVLALLIIHRFNYSVYAWNVAMVVFSYFLCKRNPEEKLMERIKQNTYIKLALFLFILVPSSHFIGIAGSKISFDVYSGKYAYTYVYISPEMYPRLPEKLKKCSIRMDAEHDDYKLFIDIWAEKENRASIYYETWALKKYKKYFERYSEGQPIKLVTLKDNKEQLVE